jgi:hypothetical protein
VAAIAFIQEEPPSIDDLIQDIPTWILDYIQQAIVSDVPGDLYADIYNFLPFVFPASRRFMIVPQ